jgi:hypothetical protein
VPTKAKSTAAPMSEDAIRHRAYLMWEADGRPDGMADHYWQKASEPAPDVGTKPKDKAAAAKTASAHKAGNGKTADPAGSPGKTKVAKPPKLKAAAAKVGAPAVKAKPAAKAPSKKAAKAAKKD